VVREEEQVPVETIGIDHIFVTVRDLKRSETFYDRFFEILGFRKNASHIAGEPHRHYYCRHFGYSLRPAQGGADHNPYAPGLHHFCFRVDTVEDVDRAARELVQEGIEVSSPRYYPEYAADYYASFVADPDGVRLEITNFREQRKKRMFEWEDS
jgi:catechol 2,3-dioxygenase-like lactoylglutathione lyase family enzyme